MAAKRQRSSGTWEFTVKRKGVLPKPVSLTFKTEAEGDAYCAHLEKLLDRGIVPDEFKDTPGAIKTVCRAIDTYLKEVHVTRDDEALLFGISKASGSTVLSDITYKWAERWIAGMRDSGLAPSTTRKKVGAFARCLDYVIRRQDTVLISNPLRMLPKRYSSAPGKTDDERDRRLHEGEEARILSILNREKPDGRERPLALPHADELALMFTLALETAMRMREIYTLTWEQVDLGARTLFLDKTKNGDKRQVPLTSVALSVLSGAGAGRVFPGLWDGRLEPAALRATTGRLSQQWARIFGAAMCDGLHFHDLRHEATSRMYERTKLSDVQISRITGHKSLQMLRRYSNLRGSDLASQMW